MWIYLQTEPQSFSVGFYDPSGDFISESDWGTREEASQRVHFLNGGQ